MTRCWLALGRRDEAEARRCRRAGQRRGSRTALADRDGLPRDAPPSPWTPATPPQPHRRRSQAADLADAVGTPVEAGAGPHDRGPRPGLARMTRARGSASSNRRPPSSTAAAPCATATQRNAQLRQLGQHIHRRTRPGDSDTGVRVAHRRELEIARLIVDRKTNGEIARELFLSKKTVETHIRNMFRKLDAAPASTSRARSKQAEPEASERDVVTERRGMRRGRGYERVKKWMPSSPSSEKPAAGAVRDVEHELRAVPALVLLGVDVERRRRRPRRAAGRPGRRAARRRAADRGAAVTAAPRLDEHQRAVPLRELLDRSSAVGVAVTRVVHQKNPSGCGS